MKEYPFQAAVRNSEILGIFSLRVGTDVFPALRERGMNAIFSGVRLYLGGITMISLSSYVQDGRLFCAIQAMKMQRNKAGTNLFAACLGTVDLRSFVTTSEHLCSEVIA